MAVTHAAPAPTAEEQRQLKAFFEQTRTLPGLLSTLRSRRVARGYHIESGATETHPSTGHTLHQPKGPLAFASEHPVEPLSEVEEAIIAWAGLGPNGIVHWDIAVQGGFHEVSTLAGRTAAAGGNSFAHDLLIIKDEGVFLYRPTTDRERMVEIQSEADYGKVLRWYREGCTQLLDHRPDIDWMTRVPGCPNATLFGPYQYNIMRPGTTWFLPICDIGWLYFSVILNIFDAWHIYYVDDATQKPAGVEKWVGEGKLEFPVTISQIEQFIFQVESYPPGSIVQNIKLAAEATGHGAWIFCGFFDDVLMGAFPDVAKGMGFATEPLNARAPLATGAVTVRGIEGVLESTYVPSPRYPDGATITKAMVDDKYGRGRCLSKGDDNWMLRNNGPFKPETVREIVNHPAVQVSDWAKEAMVAYVDYCVEKYGRCPVTFNPMQCNFGAVVHHVDEAFYEKYYDGSSLTPEIRNHMRDWH
jgi:hypothetical protein